MSRIDLDVPPAKGSIFLDFVSGKAGPCICLGNQDGGYRIAGPKPWGGGRTQHRFSVDIEELKKVIADYEVRHG